MPVPDRILGISAYYHDSAACLVVGGDVVAAAQEERFTRKKHDASFPSHAVAYCLKEAGLTIADIDLVGFYEKPLVKFGRLLESYLAVAPRGLRSYLMAMPQWLTHKLWLADGIRRELGREDLEVLFGDHHESHAASAFYPSPFEDAAILTMDGVGEWATSSIGARPRIVDRDVEAAAISAFRRAALLGVHLFHRVQGELGRVQGDGPRAVRQAAVRLPRSATTSSTSTKTAASVSTSTTSSSCTA